VQGNGGFTRINHDGAMVNLCCPHISEQSVVFSARLTIVGLFRDLKEAEKQ
jgi:hypothetical protein